MHHRFCEILEVLVSLLHLLPQAACRGIVAGGATAEGILPNLSVGHTHGEVGIRVVRQVLFHPQFGGTEVFLLFQGDIEGKLLAVRIDLCKQFREVESILHAQPL